MRSGETNSVVTCVQHIFNEGPTQGSRNKNMMRMVSSWKRAGIPFIVALNGIVKWSQGELDISEIERTVANVYDNQYIYGCDDAILMEYCDPKCIHFKRKDYVLDIRDVSFKYKDKKYILKNLNETIRKGDILAISGPSGSGKSTLLDLITGFKAPNDGDIYIGKYNVNSNFTRANASSWNYTIRR